jgi:hypothetical protein
MVFMVGHEEFYPIVDWGRLSVDVIMWMGNLITVKFLSAAVIVAGILAYNFISISGQVSVLSEPDLQP